MHDKILFKHAPYKDFKPFHAIVTDLVIIAVKDLI